MIDCYFRSYKNDPAIAVDVAADLRKLIGYKAENHRIHKKLPNVLFLNVLTYVFDFEQSKKLLRRLSKNGVEMTYDDTVLR